MSGITQVFKARGPGEKLWEALWLHNAGWTSEAKGMMDDLARYVTRHHEAIILAREAEERNHGKQTNTSQQARTAEAETGYD